MPSASSVRPSGPRQAAAWLILALSCLAGAATTTAQEEQFDCSVGCRKAFKPACGTDGHTYASACLAACQGVKVAHKGACPGEPVLNPTNTHVVTGEEKGPGGVLSAAGKPSVLAPSRMHAFRHEGFRYSGQVAFTQEVAVRKHNRRNAAGGVGAAAAAARNAASAPLSTASQAQGAGDDADLGLGSTGPRVLRVTREGHMYVADLEESVATILDSLIDAASNTSASKDGAPTGRRANALLHNLRTWRNYRGGQAGAAEERQRQQRSAVGGSGGGGAKWKRSGIITGDVMGEHTLQPELEATAAVQPARIGAQQQEQEQAGGSSSNGRQEQTQTQERVQQEETGAGWASWGSWGRKQDKQEPSQQQQQQQQPAEEAAGADRPYRQARRQLGIFESDDRVDCPRTPTYPFTASGQIQVRDASGSYVCSGALVGPDVVLTAAHCVFSRGSGTFYDKLDFSPGRYRTLDGTVVNPFGIIPWTHVTVYQAYTLSGAGDPNIVDIAIIKLSQKVGTTTGWMGVFEPCSALAPTRYVALTAGYPSDQPLGSCKTTQCVVMQDPCTDGYLYHKCDTASGQSGSPMWMSAMTAARKMGPFIRAVHNIEWVQELPGGGSQSYINSAVSITPDHYRTILAWIAPSFDADLDTNSPMVPTLPPKVSTSTSASGRRR
ncbi:hypothetical protein HYH03_000621 [Edaphochlamys debaryana]|uniref:Serine protease n=1 Tax=Edaphochlamys debaryana TaxID=47281 RepID=A0A835YHT9_9CHLO|nr:hypothetical protein HYH03_000621 [Edaphochlamys debaryana]|eukprot:KAG2502132.1 hypothetical protein HYH03_000621 [Edaphochlamys debaryana]